MADLILPSPVLPPRPMPMLASPQYPQSCHLLSYPRSTIIVLNPSPSFYLRLSPLSSNHAPNVAFPTSFLSSRSSPSSQTQCLDKFLLSSLHSNPSSFRLPHFNAATTLLFMLMSLPVNAQAAQPALHLLLCRPFVLPTHPPLFPPTLPERAQGGISTTWGLRPVGRSIEGMGRSGMEARDCEERCARPLAADF